MRDVHRKAIISVFWTLVVVSALIVTFMLITMLADIESFSFLFIVVPAILLSASGIALIILAARNIRQRLLRSFFLLTGSSATAITLSAILHNLVYALIVYLADKGLFTLPDNFDEPFFFMIAIIVAPLGLVVGIIGTAILIYGKKMMR